MSLYLAWTSDTPRIDEPSDSGGTSTTLPPLQAEMAAPPEQVAQFVPPTRESIIAERARAAEIAPRRRVVPLIEVVANDRLGGKVRIKCRCVQAQKVFSDSFRLLDCGSLQSQRLCRRPQEAHLCTIGYETREGGMIPQCLHFFCLTSCGLPLGHKIAFLHRLFSRNGIQSTKTTFRWRIMVS